MGEQMRVPDHTIAMNFDTDKLKFGDIQALAYRTGPDQYEFIGVGLQAVPLVATLDSKQVAEGGSFMSRTIDYDDNSGLIEVYNSLKPYYEDMAKKLHELTDEQRTYVPATAEAM